MALVYNCVYSLMLFGRPSVWIFGVQINGVPLHIKVHSAIVLNIINKWSCAQAAGLCNSMYNKFDLPSFWCISVIVGGN